MINYIQTKGMENKANINEEKGKEANRLMPDVVSENSARKLARIGWLQGQTKKSYHKRPHCSIYDLVEKKGVAGWGWDAPDKGELQRMCDLAKCNISDTEIELLVDRLIIQCKINNIRLNSYNINKL